MRQLIIARKDLGMSPGKLSSQVAHASNAWFMELIRNNAKSVMDPEFQRMRVYDPFRKEKRIVSYRHPRLYQWCAEADGIGRTPTCIGFRPLPDDVAHEISRKYQLYK